MYIKFLIAGLCLLICFGCGSEDDGVFAPKPRAFPRVMYPQNTTYQQFDESYCNFTFQFPSYGVITQDKLFFDEEAKDPCWFDIDVKELNGRIHCSYYPINKENSFDQLRTDAFTLAGKHTVKADYIDELPINKPNNVNGFVFDIQGPAASPFQFYLTDSTHHFLRGSLYINAKAEPDSLAPIYEFMKKDVMHLINTFEWK